MLRTDRSFFFADQLTFWMLLSLLLSTSSLAWAQSTTPPPNQSSAEELAFWEEMAFWEAVKDTDNAAELEAYLETYPQGRFTTLAKVRIQALRAAQTAPESSTESQNQTSETSTPEVDSEKSPETPITAQPEATQARYYKVRTHSNVRAEPSTSAQKIGLLKPGERVLVLDLVADDRWYRVRLSNGDTAYIFAELLEPEAPTPEADQLIASRDPSISVENADITTGSLFRDCNSCPMMVAIPSGQFTMGSNAYRADEQPPRTVTIDSPFAIGIYEISNAQWDACVNEGGCDHNPPSAGYADESALPISNVSWDDAQQYIRWLSTKTGQIYRLPSEAEWEYATRGGTDSVYWWGDTVMAGQANCKGCGSRWDNRQPAPIDAFKANPFGLHNVHGNVWEWTTDCWNRSYSGAPTDASPWLSGDCLARVLRGGAWKLSPEYLRASRRSKYDKDVRYFLNGFRVARSLP